MRRTVILSLIAVALLLSAAFLSVAFLSAAAGEDAEAPKLEPISSRLAGRLRHSNHGKDDDFIVEISFSPDGKRLIAGDRPGGMINVWDVASGKRLAEMETGAGLGGEIDYFTVSPDWKTIYALTKHRGRKRETLQTEGRQFWRWSFDDAVQVFDVESGKLTGSWQHTPAREIRTLTFSPNGAYFVTADGVPGIYEDQYKRTMSLWNTQTGSHQDLDDRYDNSSVLFSPDGKQIALTTKADDYDRTITIVDAADLQPRTVILLPPGYVRAWPCAFCMGGAICAVRTTIYRFENDLGSSSTALRFYDVKTGAEVFQAPAPKKGESFYPVALSADGNTLAAVIWELNESPGQLLLVSAGSWKSQFIELGQHVGVGGLAFHPKGKWLAVGVQVGQANPPPSFVPQSQIRIVDVASGKTLETLAMPPCYPQAVAFSPDGKTLATSGQGEVLLWDFSKPPGEK